MSKTLVFASFENAHHDHCVDVFQRADGSFGFEAFRRDPDGGGTWQSLAKFGGLIFASKAATFEAAEINVSWLADLATFRLVTAALRAGDRKNRKGRPKAPLSCRVKN